MVISQYILLGFALFLPVLASYFGVLHHRGFLASLVKPSYCDGCGRRLRWYELIPIFSAGWVLLKRGGNATCCKELLSKSHLASELFALGMGLVLAVWGILYSPTLLTVLVVISATIALLYFSVEDLRSLSIPVPPMLVLIALVLGIQLYYPTLLADLAFAESVNLFAALGYTAIVAGLILISRGKGLGSGDMLYSFFIGATLGWKLGLVAHLAAVYAAAIAGIMLVFIKRKFHGQIVPLIPFLQFGWTVGLLFGPEIASFARPYFAIFSV